MPKEETIVLTHRGLDPDKGVYFSESSYEAFEDQLMRGFGIEFDVHFTKDHIPVALHDKNVARITNGKDSRLISEIAFKELETIFSAQGKLATIPEVFSLIENKSSTDSWSALHVKHEHQNTHDLDLLLQVLSSVNHSKFIIFDISISSARYIKEKDSLVQIFASVAHPYDTQRFNPVVGNTLLTLDELENTSDMYNGAWLDEWDRLDKNGTQKKLYTEDVFTRLREKGLKIGVVSPELHSSSPSLLANESHQDAKSRETLTTRMREILTLKPDAYCTDFPDHVKSLLTKF